MELKVRTLEAGRAVRGRIRQITSVLHWPLPLSERRLLLLFGDVVAVCGAVLIALRLWAWAGGHPFGVAFIRPRWFWFPSLLGAWGLLAWLTDLYDVPTANRRSEVPQRVALALLELTAGYLALYFFLPRNALPRLFYLFFAVVAMISVTMWRWAYATLFTLPPLRRRILIVGAGWAGRVLAQALVNQEQADYHVVGFVDDDPAKQGTKVAGLPVLGGSAEMLRLVRRYRVDDVVLAITHELRGELFQALLDCQAVGVHMIHMPDLYEQLTRQVPVEHVDEGWVLGALNGFPSPGHLERAARRLLDLFCGSLGLIGLGCLLPFICLAIYLDDGGPVFYTQVRAGLGGRPFRVIKFRTMRTDAEPDGRPRWAREGDDRATRVGRILRKTRLDELPQVINILRGEMSVVGPRPERPEFIAELEKQIPFYRARLVVKPGLTGWAQIHYGYGNSVKDALIKLQYDLYYIRHRSLWLDLYVIFKTVGVVLRGSGI